MSEARLTGNRDSDPPKLVEWIELICLISTTQLTQWGSIRVGWGNDVSVPPPCPT